MSEADLEIVCKVFEAWNTADLDAVVIAIVREVARGRSSGVEVEGRWAT
jgi:hypothetical protein